jgi:thioredoxin-related protein
MHASRIVSSLLLFVALVLMVSAVRAKAARDPAGNLTAAVEPAGELVVYEAASSIYCKLFRRDVLPTYLSSPRALRVPIRFVEITAPEAEADHIVQTITTVPTIVFLKEGVEEGRIVGYVGPENFFHVVSRLLGPLE